MKVTTSRHANTTLDTRWRIPARSYRWQPSWPGQGGHSTVPPAKSRVNRGQPAYRLISPLNGSPDSGHTPPTPRAYARYGLGARVEAGGDLMRSPPAGLSPQLRKTRSNVRRPTSGLADGPVHRRYAGPWEPI